MTSQATFKSRSQALLSALLALVLLLGTFSLTACGNKDEQDNCYGEDMPVINEE